MRCTGKIMYRDRAENMKQISVELRAKDKKVYAGNKMDVV